jgi:cell shape-determining protein MreD
MRISKLKLSILIIFISCLQLLINSQTSLYLDCIGIVLVLLLISDSYSLKMLIILSFYADLIGHWYLGSHLFATLLLSFLTGAIVRFFYMCSTLQKISILVFFYTLFVVIITAINLITHNFSTDSVSFLVEAIILCPIIFILFSYTKVKHSENIIL